MPRADRLIQMLHLLAGRRALSMQELSEKLDTSPRSIYRDLNNLEERGFPLQREEGRYRFMPDSTPRPVPLTEKERLILILALENGALEKQPGFRKTLKGLRTHLSSTYGLPESVVVVSGPDRSGTIDEKIVDTIEKSIRDRHSISMEYQSLTARKAAWRGIDPWCVVHRCDAWYLVGRCHVHKEPRVFRLDRISGVLPIGSTFERPDFNPDEFFGASWGVLKSDEKNDVVIHFSERVAPLVMNANHHPSETKELLEDGSVEYKVRISALDELARWVCGFGGDAVVVAPAALSQLVYDIAYGAASAHRQTRAAMTLRVPSKKKAGKG